MTTGYANMPSYGASGAQITDANFRKWGKSFTDAIDNCIANGASLTQVFSDIDWATVAYPAADNTYAGSRVYRFNDSLSGTREVYVQIQFGRGTDSTASSSYDHVRLRMKVTVGSAWSGSAITGTSTSQYLSTEGNVAGEDQDVLVCFIDGIFVMTLNWGAVGAAPFVAVERSRNYLGAITADGAALAVAAYLCNSTGASSAYQATFSLVDWSRSLARSPSSSWGPTTIEQAAGVDTTYNNTTRVVPISYSAGEAHGYMRSIALFFVASVAVQTQVHVLDGEDTLTYRTMGSAQSAIQPLVLAYRWD